MVEDHRGADALAQIGEIGPQRDRAGLGRGKLALQGRDRHDAVVRIADLRTRLVGLHLARALHQHAGDDLQAVGDAVLQFLHQHLLFADHIVLLLFDPARVGDVLDGDGDPRIGADIVEQMRVDDQLACVMAEPHQIHVIGRDRRVPRHGGAQQRAQLPPASLARAELGQGRAGDGARREIERRAKGAARGAHDELFIEQQQRRGRRHDQCQAEAGLGGMYDGRMKFHGRSPRAGDSRGESLSR
jgi:hypothetical protein